MSFREATSGAVLVLLAAGCAGRTDTVSDSSTDAGSDSSGETGDSSGDHSGVVRPTAETGTSSTGDTAARPPENVLVIVADDLGIEFVAAYGVTQWAPAPMPVLDSLVAQGVLFENAYATPVCSSSRAALLTGRHGRRHGIGGVIGDYEDAMGLPEEETTLGELVRRSDVPYRTVGIGKWHLANPNFPRYTEQPNRQGFDWYAGSPSNLGEANEVWNYFHWKKNTNGELSESDEYATVVTVDDALAQLQGASDPWFAFVSFNAPHEPSHVPPAELLAGPPPDEAAPPWDLTRAMCEALDHELGRLLDGLGPEVLAHTTVFFLGDNGSGEAMRGPPYAPGKGSMDQSGVRVPLLVVGPRVTAPGSRSPALVHVVDVFPTVAELVGVDVTTLTGPKGGRLVLDGQSLLPHLLSPTTPSARTTVLTEWFAPNGPPDPTTGFTAHGVQDLDYSLVLNNDREELFDLRANWPVSGPNLLADGTSPAEAAQVSRLRKELQGWLDVLDYAY